MFRKIGCCILGFFCLLWMAVPVRAVERGAIGVSIDSGLTDVVGRRLLLYRVGEQTEGGYRITEEFGGGLVLNQDALSPHLARMLANTQGSGGAFRMVDGDNTAFFSGLEPGLYLLTEDGEEPMILPYMVAMPQAGSWQVMAYPAVKYYATPNPGTGQHPGPILGALGMVASSVGLAVCAGIRRKK